jgi:hypothetical protein
MTIAMTMVSMYQRRLATGAQAYRSRVDTRVAGLRR